MARSITCLPVTASGFTIFPLMDIAADTIAAIDADTCILPSINTTRSTIRKLRRSARNAIRNLRKNKRNTTNIIAVVTITTTMMMTIKGIR